MFTLLLRHDNEPVKKLPLGRYKTLRGAKMAMAHRIRHPVQGAWLYIQDENNNVLVIMTPSQIARKSIK